MLIINEDWDTSPHVFIQHLCPHTVSEGPGSKTATVILLSQQKNWVVLLWHLLYKLPTLTQAHTHNQKSQIKEELRVNSGVEYLRWQSSELEWGRRRLRTAGPSGFSVWWTESIQARPKPPWSHLAREPASEHRVKSQILSVPFVRTDRHAKY